MNRKALSHLADLNRHVEEAVTLLRTLSEYPELQVKHFSVFQAYFIESLADANLAFMEVFKQFELESMKVAGEETLAYEKTIRDPDDCYFEVVQRERELRNQGKPSKIGILHGMPSRDRPERPRTHPEEPRVESDTDDD